MASARQDKPCVQCQNGVATCNECDKRFCLPHFMEHRQQLDKQMDEVVQEHNQLRDALSRQRNASQLCSRIDAWEQASIRKITAAAEQARADFQELFDRAKHRVGDSLGKIADQLKSKQESNLYTEKEIGGWIKQLDELRKMLEKPMNIDIIDDTDTRSSLRMIKVIEKSNSEELLMPNEMITPSEASTVRMSTEDPSKTTPKPWNEKHFVCQFQGCTNRCDRQHGNDDGNDGGNDDNDNPFDVDDDDNDDVDDDGRVDDDDRPPGCARCYGGGVNDGVSPCFDSRGVKCGKCERFDVVYYQCRECNHKYCKNCCFQ